MLRLFLIAALLAPSAAEAGEYVRGYIRRDGTSVQPHYRSSPDGSRWNNYSTDGNVNPYTGESGSVNPYSGLYGYGR